MKGLGVNDTLADSYFRGVNSTAIVKGQNKNRINFFQQTATFYNDLPSIMQKPKEIVLIDSSP